MILPELLKVYMYISNFRIILFHSFSFLSKLRISPCRYYTSQMSLVRSLFSIVWMILTADFIICVQKYRSQSSNTTKCVRMRYTKHIFSWKISCRLSNGFTVPLGYERVKVPWQFMFLGELRDHYLTGGSYWPLFGRYLTVLFQHWTVANFENVLKCIYKRHKNEKYI